LEKAQCVNLDHSKSKEGKDIFSPNRYQGITQLCWFYSLTDLITYNLCAVEKKDAVCGQALSAHDLAFSYFDVNSLIRLPPTGSYYLKLSSFGVGDKKVILENQALPINSISAQAAIEIQDRLSCPMGAETFASNLLRLNRSLGSILRDKDFTKKLIADKMESYSPKNSKESLLQHLVTADKSGGESAGVFSIPSHWKISKENAPHEYKTNRIYPDLFGQFSSKLLNNFKKSPQQITMCYDGRPVCHAVLAIGMKWDNKNNQCKLIVRDSATKSTRELKYNPLSLDIGKQKVASYQYINTDNN
jgi:hypothetical protein